MLEIFFTALGGTGAALAIAAFLGKRFLDLQVSKAIEKYKSELEQRSAALKTELSIYAHEQNVGLSRLDEQRSKAIQDIYGLAMKWHDIYLEINLKGFQRARQCPTRWDQLAIMLRQTRTSQPMRPAPRPPRERGGG